MADKPKKVTDNKYRRILEHIFLSHYHKGEEEIEFERKEITQAAAKLDIEIPKNFGDLVYTFRYRGALPEAISSKAPKGKSWIILPAGIARYRFALTSLNEIAPNKRLVETKVPDAIPGIVEKYALDDEQGLLAKVRYNRLIDIFTGVACYSLQSHLRTTVPGMGQVETDEIYVGVDQRGAHYVFPVQAKGSADKLGVVQIYQDFALCENKFPGLICRPIAAQFMADDLIALFALERNQKDIAISLEKHYRLVPPEAVSAADLETYRGRTVEFPR